MTKLDLDKCELRSVSGRHGGFCTAIEVLIPTDYEYQVFRIELKEIADLIKDIEWEQVPPNGRRKYTYLTRKAKA